MDNWINRGKTWTNLGRQAAIDYMYKVMYIGNNIWLAACDDSTILRSIDDGLTWTPIVFSEGATHRKLLNLGNGVIVSFLFYNNPSNYYYVWISYDWGQTWQRKGNSIGTIHITGSLYSYIYVENIGTTIYRMMVYTSNSTKSRLFVSTDYGDTWIDKGIVPCGGSYNGAYWMFKTLDNRIVCNSFWSDGVSVATSNGDIWSQVSQPPNKVLTRMYPITSQIIVANAVIVPSTYEKWISYDNLNSWTKLDVSLTNAWWIYNESNSSITADLDGTFLVLCNNGYMFRSHDSGKSWIEFPSSTMIPSDASNRKAASIDVNKESGTIVAVGGIGYIIRSSYSNASTAPRILKKKRTNIGKKIQMLFK